MGLRISLKGKGRSRDVVIALVVLSDGMVELEIHEGVGVFDVFYLDYCYSSVYNCV